MFFYHHVDAGLKTGDDEVIEAVENFKLVHGSVTQNMILKSERLQLG